MKRRLISSIIAIIAIISILLSFTVTAYADDGVYVDTSNGYYSADVDVDYHAYSTYTIYLPYTFYEGVETAIKIDLSNVENGYHIEGYVTNLDENGQISLLPNDTNKNNEVCKISMTSFGNPIPSESGYFGSFMYEGDYECEVPVGYVIDEAPTKADMYYGTICFKFECVMD